MLNLETDHYFPGGGIKNFPLQTFFMHLPANNFFFDLFKLRSDTKRRFLFAAVYHYLINILRWRPTNWKKRSGLKSTSHCAQMLPFDTSVISVNKDSEIQWNPGNSNSEEKRKTV